MHVHARRPQRQNLRRLASLLALAGVLFSSLGIVLVPGAKRDSSQAFPCQGGQCGCASAAQCWQSCCCTSIGERLAWAEAHDVAPPAFLVELLAEAVPADVGIPVASCCQAAGGSGVATEPSAGMKEDSSPAQVILLSDLSRCRGLSRYIAIFGAAICEPLPDAPAFDGLPILWLRTLDDSFESPLPAPPTPPPRVVG